MGSQFCYCPHEPAGVEQHAGVGTVTDAAAFAETDELRLIGVGPLSGDILE